MSRIRLTLLVLSLALVHSAAVWGAEQHGGAHRVEDAKPLTPGDVSSQNALGGPSVDNSTHAASAALSYGAQNTRRVLLKDARRLFRPRNGGHAPIRESVRPIGVANLKIANERQTRSVTFNVPKVDVVNTTPYFRFIRIDDHPKKPAGVR